MKLQSQDVHRDSRSALGRVSGGGRSTTDTMHAHVFRVDNRSSGIPDATSAVSLAGDGREPMVEQCSSEDKQSTRTPGPTSALSLAGDSREPMVAQCSSEDNQSTKTPGPTSAVFLAEHDREPMVEQCCFEDKQSTRTPGPTSAVSLAGDGREPMVEQCCFEDKQSTKTPGPTSAVPLAGDSRELLVGQCSLKKKKPGHQDPWSTLGRVSGRGRPGTDGRTMLSWDNKSTGTPVETSAVSPAGDNKEPLVAQCTGTFERVPSLTYTSRARNTTFTPTTRKSIRNFP